MNVSNFNAGGDATGIHFKGVVRTTYDRLVEVFGKPEYGPNFNPYDYEKVTCEWVITFEDGSVATIYDWKENGGTPRHCYAWHIGGMSNTNVVDYINSLVAAA